MFDQIQKRETKMLISESLAYKGRGAELALVMCKNFALTVLTFGFYMAWARTNTRRYIWNNVSFLDDRAAYLGTGKELFRGWAIVGSLYVGVALVFGVFNRMVPLNVQMITSILLIPFYVYLYSLIIYGGSRYRLACTKWREVRFGMKRNHKLAKDFFLLNLKGTFFTVLTLGVYLPFYQNKKRAFLVNNSHLGTGKFYYGGDAKEYALLFFKGVFFSIITLGIYLPWMILS